MNAGFRRFKLIFFCWITATIAWADITVVSWNMRHLGRADQDLKRVAYILPRTDLIMFQEVNVGPAGLTALRKVAEELTTLAARRYCVAISEKPSDARDRYAMLWNQDTLAYEATGGERITRCPEKPVTLRLGDRFAEKIIREPAFGVFEEKATGKRFLAATVHVVPQGRRDGIKPKDEIPFIFETVEFVATDPTRPLEAVILGGDFNLNGDDEVFDAPKKRGFRSALSKMDKTSLKRTTQGYSQAFDNIFVRKMRLRRGTVAPVFDKFPDLTPEEIFNRISDHAPIKAVLDFMD